MVVAGDLFPCHVSAEHPVLSLQPASNYVPPALVYFWSPIYFYIAHKSPPVDGGAYVTGNSNHDNHS